MGENDTSVVAILRYMPLWATSQTCLDPSSSDATGHQIVAKDTKSTVQKKAKGRRAENECGTRTNVADGARSENWLVRGVEVNRGVIVMLRVAFS